MENERFYHRHLAWDHVLIASGDTIETYVFKSLERAVFFSQVGSIKFA